jgi:lysophospholipase L1-like esterase
LHAFVDSIELLFEKSLQIGFFGLHSYDMHKGNLRKSKIPLSLMMMAVLFSQGCRQDTPKTIVCIGDSLTVCGGEGGRYTDWLAQWLAPHDIFNKGVNGDTLAGGRSRFERDVLALKPDVVVVELGANDFWQMKRPIEQLRKDLEDMVSRAKKAGAEVVIASCFGNRDYAAEKKVEYGVERYRFADQIWLMEEDVCHRYGCLYVPNVQADIKPNGKKPYWDDTNHPNKEGNRFVAKRILTAMQKALAAAK